ncbi:MAG: PDZ domain-containing protein [Porphyromonadaceae bacterium]|nr:PDZ domain-containing protein [Porphyromonadaceae bacterium]
MKKNILFIIIISFLSLSCSTEKNGVKFEKDGHFYIYAVINDSIEGRFVFDTGASGLYLDSIFVKNHNSIIKSILDTARMRGAGATGYKQVLLIKDSVSISVGNYVHNFTNSPILKLTDINGENIAGIIGNEFIKNQILIVDNDKLTLKIDTVVDTKKYEITIPFQFDNGRIYLPVDLTMKKGQTVTSKLLVDLGCSDAIILNSPYFKSLKKSILPDNIIDYTILYGGALGGNSDGGDFRITSIKLGNDIINNPIISFSKDTLGAFSKTDYDGLLGNEILDRYNYAIDYHAQKLYLTKNATSKKNFKSSLTGFYAMKTNDVAIVMSVYYQSDAYKNGIKLGDTIVAINDKKVKDLTEKEFYEEMNGEGKQIKVTVLRNENLIEVSFYLKYLI